jgi:hypothetical protein
MQPGTAREKIFTTRQKLVEAIFDVNLKCLKSKTEPGLTMLSQRTVKVCNDVNETHSSGINELP